MADFSNDFSNDFFIPLGALLARTTSDDIVVISEIVMKRGILNEIEVVTISEAVAKLSSLGIGEIALVITDSASAIVQAPGSPSPAPSEPEDKETTRNPRMKIYWIMHQGMGG